MSWRAVGVVYAILALLVAVVLLSDARKEEGGPPPDTAPANVGMSNAVRVDLLP